MKCPIDNTELHMTDRQGIEIDYCPTCRGVWLDRGELDKIIDRSGGMPPDAGGTIRQEYHKDPRYAKQHRKEGFLGDLFDF